MSADGDDGGGGAGTREVAYRLFAAEFDDADLSYSESDEERAPNYVVTPTGGRVNRLFAVGVLTEVERVSDEVLRARIVDPTGAFVVYAGQYQPEAMNFLERAQSPAFVAATGKARTFQPDDSDVVYTSVRPESLNEVDAGTRDRWTVAAAERTLDRIARVAAAKRTGLAGDELREALVADGVDEGLAAGIPLALEHYGTTGDYLAALRETALDALRVVAGEADEAEAPSMAPGAGGDDRLAESVESDVDVPASATADADADVAKEPATEAPADGAETSAGGTETAEGADAGADVDTGVDASAGSGAASESSVGTGDAGSTAEAGTADVGTDSIESTAETGSTADAGTADTGPTSDSESTADAGAGDAGSDPDVGLDGTDEDPEIGSGSDVGTEPGTDLDDAAGGSSDLGDAGGGLGDAEAGGGLGGSGSGLGETGAEFGDAGPEPGETAGADSSDAGGSDDELGDFEPEFDLDDEEREELQAEYGAEFRSGTEVDEPGEAGIETPDPDELAEEAADAGAETAGTGAAGETGGADAGATDAAVGSGASEDTAVVDEAGASADTDAGTADVDGMDADDTDDADDEPAVDVDLEDAVMDAMEELDGGSGADREELTALLVDRHGADPGEVEDAIQDALMGGRCYEPDDTHLKPI